MRVVLTSLDWIFGQGHIFRIEPLGVLAVFYPDSWLAILYLTTGDFPKNELEGTRTLIRY